MTGSSENCGCCGRGAVGLIEHADNRPSLASIAFRLGTFTSFRSWLLHELVRERDLGALRTRVSDDYAITLLELWAVIADVLTFYQERIANEAYLGTAKLRESVGRLVRLIDYELRPALAATARVAFTLERVTSMTVPRGLRLQSVPGPDEKPQKYETLERLEATLALNRVRVFGKLEPHEPFAVGSTGGTLLTAPQGLAAGGSLLVFDAFHVERKIIAALEAIDGRFSLQWEPPIASSEFRHFTTRAAPLRGQSRLFGHNAPTTYMSIEADATAPNDFRSVLHTMATTDFEVKRSATRLMNSFALDHLSEDVSAGSLMVIAQEGPSTSAPAGFARLARVAEVASSVEKIAPQANGDPPPPALTGTVTRLRFAMAVKKPPIRIRGVVGSTTHYVLTIGDDDALWVRTHVFTPNDDWSGDWKSLGGRVKDFAVERLSSNRLAVVATAMDGSVWLVAQTVADGPWSAWQALDGAVVEELRIARDPLDAPRLLVFGRRRDGSIAVNVYDQTTNSPSGWLDLDGEVDQVFIGGGDGQRLVIIGRGSDGWLWYREQQSAVLSSIGTTTNAWGPWKQRSDPVLEILAVANDAIATVEVFGRGADAKLRHIALPLGGDFPTTWQSLGGPDVATFRVVADDGGGLHAFVLSPEKALFVIPQLTSGSPWSSSWRALDQLAPDLFDVGLNVAGELDVFAAGPDIHVMHRDSGGDWNTTWSSIDTIHDTLRADMLALDRMPNGRLVVMARGAEGALWGQVELNNHTWPITWSAIGVPMWPIDDLRQIVVHELTHDPVSLWSYRYPSLISGASIYARLNDLTDVVPNRLVLLDDQAGPPVPATVSSASAIDADLDGVLDHLEISVSSALARPLAGLTAVLYGNVALASHGESVPPEVLGDADATIAFQRFALGKKPVTHLASTAGLSSSVDLRVNDIQWRQVPTLYGRSPTAQVYVSRLRDDGTLVVQFGDGEQGARPPSGAGNVVARYRQGAGVEGRVRAGTLTNLLDRPVGLRAATNPLPAEGGVDRENENEARRNAPTKVKTFDRAVSLRDVEDLATSSGEIAKASAALVWDGDVQAVHLSVAAAGGLVPGADVLGRLASSLDARRDPNRNLMVVPFTPIPVVIAATLRVVPTQVATLVAKRAREAMIGALAFETLAFGQSVNLSDVYAVLQDVAGVESVDIDVLQFKGYETMTPAALAARGATTGPVQSRLRIFTARPNQPPLRGASPAEQARLENPDTDLLLTTSGGLTD